MADGDAKVKVFACPHCGSEESVTMTDRSRFYMDTTAPLPHIPLPGSAHTETICSDCGHYFSAAETNVILREAYPELVAAGLLPE